MIYIERLERPDKLEKLSPITFHFSNGKTLYGVVQSSSSRIGWYVNTKDSNSQVFGMLGLDKYEFVKSTLGYLPKGDWPEAKSVEDLEKVLDALLKVNKPSEKEPVKEVRKANTDGEWGWLLD